MGPLLLLLLIFFKLSSYCESEARERYKQIIRVGSFYGPEFQTSMARGKILFCICFYVRSMIRTMMMYVYILHMVKY